MKTINFNGRVYLPEFMDWEFREKVLKEKFFELVKGSETYNINPFPSPDFYILAKEIENSELVKEIKSIALYTGTLKFEMCPLGTYYGHYPKHYEKIIVRLIRRYKY